MTGLSIDILPANVRAAAEGLATSLREILGEDLVALWLYGAVTFPDRPRRLGDIDTHAVIATVPDEATVAKIDRAHEQTARNNEIEWDSWYILEKDAATSDPPRHAFRDITDRAWALHRAHWLQGQYVLLYGRRPSEVVMESTWPELEEGLVNELRFIQRLIDEGRVDAGHAAFGIWNGCRVLYSSGTHEVVVSKREGATWALRNLPAEWSGAIEAAGRFYDAEEAADDEELLRKSFVPFISFVKEGVG